MKFNDNVKNNKINVGNKIIHTFCPASEDDSIRICPKLVSLPSLKNPKNANDATHKIALGTFLTNEFAIFPTIAGKAW
ncbi:Uncharacterised protein, partial [Metamycoplasma alkalescens]